MPAHELATFKLFKPIQIIIAKKLYMLNSKTTTNLLFSFKSNYDSVFKTSCRPMCSMLSFELRTVSGLHLLVPDLRSYMCSCTWYTQQFVFIDISPATCHVCSQLYSASRIPRVLHLAIPIYWLYMCEMINVCKKRGPALTRTLFRTHHFLQTISAYNDLEAT